MFRKGYKYRVSPATRSLLPAGWVHVEKEVTLAADQTTILFHNSGETEAYVDNLSVKAKSSDVELVPDGGFEDVNISCEYDAHVWDEGVEIQAPTFDAEGIMKYTCTECGKTKTESIDKLTGPLVGDVSGDGEVNVNDIVLARRYITGGWGVVTTDEVVDADADSKLTAKDIIIMRRFVAGGYGIDVLPIPASN